MVDLEKAEKIAEKLVTILATETNSQQELEAVTAVFNAKTFWQDAVEKKRKTIMER